MKDIMKVSTVAFNAKWGDKEANLNRMAGYIEAAAAEGSNLIVFPEMGLTGYDDEEDKPLKEKMQYKLAETVPGPSSEKIAELTKNSVFMSPTASLREMPKRAMSSTMPPVYAAPKESSAPTERFTFPIRSLTGQHAGTSLLFSRPRGAQSRSASAMIPTVSKS